MLQRLEAWLVQHPDVMVVASAAIIVAAVRNFGRAVELRAEIRRHAADVAREASEALGG